MDASKRESGPQEERGLEEDSKPRRQNASSARNQDLKKRLEDGIRISRASAPQRGSQLLSLRYTFGKEMTSKSRHI